MSGSGATSFAGVLRERAAHSPDRLAFRFVEADGVLSRTYAELDAAARVIAARLGSRARGERAVLLFPPGADYVAAFFGCLYAGAVAVPVYPPTDPRQLPRLQGVLRDCDPRFLLTMSALTPEISQLVGGAETGSGVRVIACDAPLERRADVPADIAVNTDPATPAFLQYTSGTTGTPKGVVVSHANLLANSEFIRTRFGHDAESRGVIWLPPYHDMGLIGGILQPIYAGFEVTLLSPLSFLRDPGFWLRTISTYGATTSGGPNFAFDLTVRKVPEDVKDQLDLSTWTVAFTGAEQVRPATLSHFAQAFARCGFDARAFFPCYGLAEATLMVSGGWKHDGPLVRAFSAGGLEVGQASESDGTQQERQLVGCGRADAGHEIRIVDGGARAEGEVGEIWVRGPSVSAGYWGCGDGGTGTLDGQRYLRTGDLGFFDGGELFVTGRSKDVIVLRGRNYSPDDLELTVGASDRRFRPGRGAAFTAGTDDEQLVIVYEVVPHLTTEACAEVVSAARRAVTGVHGLAVDTVVLLPPGKLPTTSSGKVQRSRCRELFTTGSLGHGAVDGSPSGPTPANDALEAVRTAVAHALDLPRSGLDVHRPLTDLGIDSVRAVELTTILQRNAGLVLPLQLVLSGADCSRLAAAARAVPATAAPGSGPPERGLDDRLTENERAMWFLQRVAPDSRAYQLCRAVEVTGRLEHTDLARGWAGLVGRHESLRTCFALRDGVPTRVLRDDAARLDHVDARDWSSDQLDRVVNELVDRPIDLVNGPVWTLTHLNLSVDRHLFVLTTHHAVADLWSLVVLLDELLAALTGAEVDATPAGSMRSVAAAERAYLATGVDADLASACDRLGDAPPVTALPTDRPRPAVRSYRGAELHLALPAQTRGNVLRLARVNEVTPYAVLLASFAWLVHRYSGADDLVLGAPSSGRYDPVTRDVVGLCVNSVPLRLRVVDEQSFDAFVSDVGAVVREGLATSRLPFARLVEALDPPREPGGTPLFGMMVSLQQAPRDPRLARVAAGVGSMSVGELTVRGRRLPPGGAEFDLVVDVVDDGTRFICDLRYDCELWDEASVADLADNWQRLLDGVGADGTQRVADLQLRSDEQPYLSRQLGDADLAITGTLGGLADDRTRLDTAASEARVGAIVGALAARGIGPEDTVGIVAERTAGFVLCALAVLRCGAMYVPLAKSDPPARLTAQLSTTKPRVVCHDGCADLLALLDVSETDQLDISAVPAGPDRPSMTTPHPDAAAYVIFTSGTTGTPKGVCVPVVAVANLLVDLDERAPLRPGAHCAWWTEPTFDVSVWEILSATRVGGRLTVVPDRVRLQPTRFAEWLADNAVESTWVPPFAIAAVTARAELAAAAGTPLALRRVLVGIEPIAHPLVQRLARAVPGLRVVNGYGPTETTVWCTFFDVEPEPPRVDIVPIGRSVANGSVYVLDRHLQPVPRGACGEVYVGGVPVARGYVASPGVTAAAWQPDPFASGGRLYRTGDLGRWNRSGELQFLGRRDQQVKVRGVRIELGEVEGALARHPAVASAAAAVRDINGQRVLVGYVVAADAASPPVPRDVVRHVEALLPATMVPGIVLLLDEMPLTRHGKLDRRSLPAPTRRPDVEAPRGDVEQVIADVWRTLFAGAGAIGRDDDFFALGGHSLLAERCALEIGRRLDRDVSVKAVMANPTVSALAATLDVEVADGDGVAIQALPRHGQSRTDLQERVAALPADVVERLLQQDGAST